jgi:Protein of unknown function (DUF4012)
VTREEGIGLDGKLRRVPIRRRRRCLRAQLSFAVLLAIVLGLAGTGGLGFLVVKAEADSLQAQLTSQLKSGQAQLEAAKSSLTLANTKHDPNQVAVAKAHFSAAKTQFEAALRLADGSPLLRGLEDMPAVGRMAQARHTAVDGIATMGSSLADVGQDLADVDSQLLTPSKSGQQGQVLLGVLNQMGTTLVKIRAELERADSAATSVDPGIVPAGQQKTFLKAKNTIQTALVDVGVFQKLVPILIEVLGGNGVRTYLIEQVNPAELRPGGGFIGTFSVLQADHGTLKLTTSGDSYQFASVRPGPGQPGYVTPPGPLREFVPTVGWSFVDSNFFPDFPSNAKAAESFVQPQMASHIDAVISMDYYTVAKMLELTGPLQVPGFGITVDANNFISQLLQSDVAAVDIVHKAILGAIAGPLMQRLSTLPPDRWSALIGALNDLAAARHLQAYFNDAAVETEMDRYGWSGALNPTDTSDFMMEVESNLGGTKANYFVTRHYAVELTHNGRFLHYKVTVDLVNEMPKVPNFAVYYHAYVRLYVGSTSSSTSDNLKAVKYPNPAPPAGTRMIDGWLPAIQGYGGHGQAVFEYDTPWQVDDSGQVTIYWQKQPGTVIDKVDVSWNDGSGHTYKVSGDLGQDRVITLTATGVILTPGQPAKAKLPSLSLG